MAELELVPTGLELEDYVAGLLQADGYYVEKGIVDRGDTSVLELDIVATDYRSGTPRRKIFEIKSGKNWGFSDIFKFLGWKTYLGEDVVDEAYFITANIPEDKKQSIEFFEAKCQELGIIFLAVKSHEELSEAFVRLGLISDEIPESEHRIWRFSLWVERQLISKVRSLRKDAKLGDAARSVIDYYDLVNNGVFFSENVRHSIQRLYEAHLEHPRLGRDLAFSIAQAKLKSGKSPSDLQVDAVMTKAMYEGEEILIQTAWYIAHRARLAIVKGVIDFACLEEADEMPEPKYLNLGSIKIPIDDPPSNFLAAVKKVPELKHMRSIPRLLQSYMWKWGGYLIDEYATEEIAALAGEADSDAETVVAALDLYDSLFTGEQASWRVSAYEVELMKIFPAEFRGIGSHWRLSQRGYKDYDEFGDPWARRHNMLKWNNSAAAVLDD
jgi:hypothetical protein